MANSGVPVYENSVKVNVPTSTPDYQGAYQDLARKSNIGSEIGAHVAQTASHAIAENLGYTAGLNPQGNLPPSLTEFDKHFSQTYNTQAAATLGLQLQQLYDNAHVEMSKSPKLTTELIKSTQDQLVKGMNQILSLAPNEAKAQLQNSFTSKLINQTSDYHEKLIQQDRTDQKNNLIYAIDRNSQDIYETASRGDFNNAELQLKVNEENIDNGVDEGFWDKSTASKLKDEARQTLINATYNKGATDAHKQRKGGEFLKSLYEHPPKNLSEAQRQSMLSSVTKQVGFLDSLVAQDQNLKVAQMLNEIAINPNGITQTKFDAFTQTVSPIQAEQVKFKLLQAVNKSQGDTTARDYLIKNYDNPEAHAISEPKARDAAFLKQVQDSLQNSHKISIPMRPPQPLSQDEAQVQIASNSASEIPVFTRLLQNKLKSANPNVVVSGLNQIHSLLQNGNGQAVSKLSDEDWSMYSAAQNALSDPDPIKALRDAHNRIYNQDPDIEKLNKQKFQSILTKKNSANISNDNYALSLFGMDKKDFLNPTLASAYGVNILNKLSGFFAISGNFEEAKQATEIWVDKNYGNTFINGGKYKTLNPIEKAVGFSGRDGVPYIQQDIINQFNNKLIPLKKDFDDKKTNEYWEVIPIEMNKIEKPIDILRKNVMHQNIPNIRAEEPKNLFKVTPSEGNNLIQSMAIKSIRDNNEQTVSSEPSKERGLFLHTYDPVKIKRFQRTDKGIKSETFNVILIGNSFGNYDVAIQTKQGQSNLFREAPQLGITTYSPNSKSILDSYNKDHQ